MQKRPCLNHCQGTILIVTLWILVILTVFAVALGQRASLEIKLAEYQRDKLRALELAKAAIERSITEKKNDLITEVDNLNESWANNELVFKDFVLGEGAFSVSYDWDGTRLYGIEDELSKININHADEQTLISLLEDHGVEDPEGLASSILIWCGKKPDSGDEEEAYYQSLEFPYHCKEKEFKSIAELLLVRGMTPEILYGKDKNGDAMIAEDEQGLVQCLTIHGPGKININTVLTKVLRALIEAPFSELVDKIVAYRKGLDGKIGTADDYWFSIDESELTANEVFFNVYGATLEEFAYLQTLEKEGLITLSSKIYTIHTEAEVRKVQKDISATVELGLP